MNDVITKSLYCSLLFCGRYAWLSRNKPDKYIEKKSEDILQNGKEVGRVAKDLFGEHEDIEYNKKLNIMVDRTLECVERGVPVITEASFRYENMFCSVDILKNTEDGFEVYEVKSSTSLEDIYIDDVSFQVCILKSLGYKVNKACVVHLNNKYVRHGDLELDKLFTIVDITDELVDPSEVKENVKRIIANLNSSEEIKNEIDINCFSPYECPFLEYCMRNLPKPNVFDIRIMKTKEKLELYKKGLISFEDLINEDLDPKYLQQIDFEINDREDYIDKNSIEEFLNTLSFPLYFLDFETFQQAIPAYDGVSPYMQIPFQYSLHYIEKEGDELNHKEFLGKEGTDPRRELALSLVRDIPNGCVLAYNMSFEKRVIKALAETYPDLEEELMRIHDSILDLMIPFYKREYYTKEMKGSYSIKYVLPALFPDDPSLNYHNLDGVHNGGEAMNAFKNLVNYSDEERFELRKNLLEYCKLDTFAMVKIWQKLNEICGKNINISI